VLDAARAAFPEATLTRTAAPGDEARLTREALDGGAETIVAIGGDGTWSHVVRTLVDERANCRLALLAAGTGNDLARNVGAPAHDAAATAELVREGCERAIDVGFVDDRCFANCAGFGFDAAVLAAAGRRRWPGGRLHYLFNAIDCLVGYGGIDASVDRAPVSRHLLLVIANGERFGGAFSIAPGADVADGQLDLVSVADAPAWGRVRLFAAATRGRHLTLPGVRRLRSTEFHLRFRDRPVYEVDGELHRAAAPDVIIGCRPRAVRVVTASGDPR
jgi:diacylglycerol kinase (ATP)